MAEDREQNAEQAYFERVEAEIARQLDRGTADAGDREERLLETRREMWENATHDASDFIKLTELNQYLDPLTVRTRLFEAQERRMERLRRMREAPYFARIDFAEGEGAPDRFYIGRCDLQDEDTCEIFVYDWRSPVASLFYRYERGPAEYEAPMGAVRGEITLKRQYEIRAGKLLYYFDADVQIADGHLREMLSHNASPRMKAIVETIQRDQDVVIRDGENGLLMVQGVAGSGKTSVALHRVAWLLYRGMAGGVEPGRIVILSPNELFGGYISQVLPELGEENVETATFEHLCARVLDRAVLPRAELYERQMRGLAGNGAAFKSSDTFLTILRRLVRYCEHRLIDFEDIYYDGKIVLDRQELRGLLYRREGCTVGVRLRQIERIALDRVAERRPERLRRLERFYRFGKEHDYDAKEMARRASVRETQAIAARLRRITRVDCAALYRRLFCDESLLRRLSKGLSLPPDLEAIRRGTLRALEGPALASEDALALTCLTLEFDGCALFRGKEQVVLDEAQDYAPAHFAALGALFPGASFTVLGDVGQTIGKCEELSLYDTIREKIPRRRSSLVTLTKSFRCTRPITLFAMDVLGRRDESAVYGREGPAVELSSARAEAGMARSAAAWARRALAEGLGSAGLLCKSEAEARELCALLGDCPDVALLGEKGRTGPGIFVLPVYLSKGLEFDAVAICGADSRRYRTQEDRRLLYVAATRALHRLAVFYTGEASLFVPQK